VNEPRLRLLGERIERLATHPEEVKAPFFAIAAPILSAFGWRPKFTIVAASSLLDALEQITPEGFSGEATALEPRAAEAMVELEANVEAAERACVLDGRVPVAQAAWLRRLYEVIVRAIRCADDAGDVGARRLAAAVPRLMILPPLTMKSAGDGRPAADEASRSEDEAADEMERVASPPEAPEVLDLELATIDHLLDAARAASDFLARRRRLLEAARQLLLEASAALALDRDGVEARRRYIAEEIVRIDRVQATGIDADVGLLHQARAAATRGDRERLHAALVALDAAALGSGDRAVAERTGEALRLLWGGSDPRRAEAIAGSVDRSSREVFGDDVIDVLRRAYADARAQLPASAWGLKSTKREHYHLSQRYLDESHDRATLAALLAVDGCFEVGGALSPLRVTEIELRARAVSHPTQDLTLLPAETLSDLPGAAIEDPRTILLALAQGRLLTRKYRVYDAIPRRRTVMVGEVRIYVLDGSGSMHLTRRGCSPGARARMRDAILLAELAALRQRCLDPRRTTRVTLFYRFFDDDLGPIVRVSSGVEAEAAMADVVGKVRLGGTDIQAALLASFEQLREARASDPELERAQIVLVTDGDAPVDEDALVAAREAVGDLPIGVSVIALGEENPALRALVARQRAHGERAFYHYIDDDALYRMAGGEIDSGGPIHLPDVAHDARKTPAEHATELEGLLGGLLTELADLERARHVERIEAAEAHAEALVDLGMEFPRALTEGEQAHILAAARDRRALEARYTRWFPPATPGGPESPDGPREAEASTTAGESADRDAVIVALAVVAEVVGEVGGSELSRRADAIDLLERLLPDARLSPARYQAVLREGPALVASGLDAVHRSVKPAVSPPRSARE
jgi:hypothetical protein